MQRHRPVEQTYNNKESVVVTQKKTGQSCFKTGNEQSFTNKVKEMTSSACKMFTEHRHQDHHGQNDGHNNQHGHRTQQGTANAHTSENHNSHASGHVQQSTCQGSNCSTASATTTDKKKKDGHGGNFMANIGEHIKNMKKKKNSKAGKYSDASSDSSSSSNSDDESNKK